MSGSASSQQAPILFGPAPPVAPRRLLTAGDLTAELDGGDLRYIRWRGVEVLRAVAWLVRDRDWGTYPARISDLEVVEAPGMFGVHYTGRCAGGAQTLAYTVAVIGTADGRLAFDVEATADTDFVTNRMGFCVLHPIVGVAGQAVEVEHADGVVEAACFPDLIAPCQPFKDIRALRHSPAPGLRAACRFEGDVFEMEDQRNWSDASFKTYVRPLALPWPYTVPAGVPQRQAVTLELTGDLDAAAAPAADETVVLRIGERAAPLPVLGLVIHPDQAAATIRNAGALAQLAPGQLLLHFDPTAGHDAGAMARLAAVAALTPAAATLELVVPGDRPAADELREAAALVAAAGLGLAAVAASPAVDRQSTPPGSAWPACPPLEEVYAAARSAFPGVSLGGGMFSYFTELNRKRPPTDLLDFVTHATCPIVHAADDRSVMETLEALPFITRSARAIAGEAKPYRIGPATIGMRQNPYGSKTTDNPNADRLPMVRADPRQHGLFAAAWMVGYWARVAPAGIEVLTSAALTGDFGLLDDDGTPRPAFAAAQMLSRIAGQAGLGVSSSQPGRVIGLAAEGPGGRRTLLAANLTADDQRVEIAGARADTAKVWMLDTTAVETLRRTGEIWSRPIDLAAGLTLPPYAVAELQWEAT